MSTLKNVTLVRNKNWPDLDLIDSQMKKRWILPKIDRYKEYEIFVLFVKRPSLFTQAQVVEITVFDSFAPLSKFNLP